MAEEEEGNRFLSLSLPELAAPICVFPKINSLLLLALGEVFLQIATRERGRRRRLGDLTLIPERQFRQRDQTMFLRSGEFPLPPSFSRPRDPVSLSLSLSRRGRADH